MLYLSILVKRPGHRHAMIHCHLYWSRPGLRYNVIGNTNEHQLTIGETTFGGLELLDGLTKRGKVIGVDLVEVAPDYDQSGSTTTLAAQLLLNFIGRIHHNRR